MAIDTVEINSAVGVDGNSYTTAISNDKLTNEDFLMLLLEEMKMQDPTKPMDSAQMMDSQLQMSTIESNMDMSNAMTALQQSYANSALSSAAGMIGYIVEDDTMGDNGLIKSYKVETVETLDGEMYLNVRELTGFVDNLISMDGDTATTLDYDIEGYIYEDGEQTDMRVKLSEDGRFELDENNNITLLNSDDEIITDEDIINKYKYNGTSIAYAENTTLIAMNSVTTVR